MGVLAFHGTPCHAAAVQIDHEAGDWPYEQVAAHYRQAIISGELAPGTRLPSLDALVRETGLSPMTIRRAFRVLADEGRVRVVPGRGTFVAPRQ